MQASPLKLLNLLGDTKTVFKIPVYQRKYEWNQEQIKQYFTDIERVIESDFKKSHFLGTIVYVQNELPGLMKERLVIDGQQRITTTLILLKAIKDIVREKNIDTINYKEIKEVYLINPYGKDETRYKLRPVDVDIDSYEKLMRGEESNSKIYENYLMCKDYIEKSKFKIEEIYEALGYLDIVYISLDESENPQIIFESLNSTGLSLTQADLIRNFILMGLKYDEQTELYRNYWKRIEDTIPNSLISDFVRDYLTMKEGEVANKNKVYDAFKQYYYSNKYSSKEILEELLRYSRYYSKIINANSEDEDVNEQLLYINNIRNTVSYPFILKVFDDFYNKEIISREELVESLKLIVSYVYRRNICNFPTNVLNKIFAIMPREVENRMKNDKTYLESVIDYLMSRSGRGIFPRNEEFKQQFLNNQLYSKNNIVVKTILHAIESVSHKEIVDINDLTVEHIMPQTLTNEWNIEIGRNAHEIHRVYKDTIGNLTLTNYNSEISNKSFIEKKEFYKESNIKITRDISNYSRWTEKEILERAENLFELVKNIWKLPKDNYKGITEDRLIPHEQYSIKDNVLVTGHSPKLIIIDNERISVSSWKDMLVKTCNYLYDFDEEVFKSLTKNKRFSRLISENKEDLRNHEKLKEGLYIETNYSAKDILSYVALLFDEYELSDMVYFEIK